MVMYVHAALPSTLAWAQVIIGVGQSSEEKREACKKKNGEKVGPLIAYL